MVSTFFPCQLMVEWCSLQVIKARLPTIPSTQPSCSEKSRRTVGRAEDEDELMETQFGVEVQDGTRSWDIHNHIQMHSI